jgi:redox-sensitive bicupin YhaK (pirin superfamily)
LFVIEGEVELNGNTVANGDQARIDNETSLKIRARKASGFILLDLPN